MPPTCSTHAIWEWDCSRHENHNVVDIISIRDVEKKLVFRHLLHICLHLKVKQYHEKHRYTICVVSGPGKLQNMVER